MGNLDWGSWFYALMYAFLGAGASSLNTALGTMIADPTDFNIQNPHKLIQVLAVSFILPGAVAFFAKLSQSPLPPVETTRTMTTVREAPGGTVVESVATKVTEEAKKP